MATITLNKAAYDNALKYAKMQNLSVDEFIVSLINKFVPRTKKKYKLKPIEELSPELQKIIGFARPAEIDETDLNGDKARMEYLTEKYT
ncbi:MAG: hypothetical protein IJ580_06815 [Prevotella sp.]|nr:hypothetical protein [Prevotella sp.]